MTSFGWCGSAIFGGILADANGSYSRSFYVTAAIQACGTLSKLLLAPLVPIHEDEEGIETDDGGEREREREGGEVNAPSPSDDLKRPLLSVDGGDSG